MYNHCAVTTLKLKSFYNKYWEGSKRVEKEKVLQITYRSKNKSRKYWELSRNEAIKVFGIAWFLKQKCIPLNYILKKNKC